MNIHKVGVDLGKTVLHLVSLNERGDVVLYKKLLPRSAFAVYRPTFRLT